ncbi:MAG: hypothetical protein GY809_24800, partial [Planctomycetes bacterium]|nr:hypothetical protein [Planctomycetota bacterium]
YDASTYSTFNEMGVYALDLDGTTAPFSTAVTNPGTIAICGNNRYDHTMLISSSAPDYLWKVEPDGNANQWGDWPGSASGTVTSLVFDELGHYEHALYAGSAFGSDDPEISGLFTLDTEGNATRFCPNLAQTEYLAFDQIGDFAHRLFAIGLEDFQDDLKIWQVDEHGKAHVFATTHKSLHRGLAFDEAGALYVAEYVNDVMTINKITGPRMVRIALEVITEEPEMAVTRIRINASGSRMLTLMLGDRCIYEGPMAPAITSNNISIGQKQPLVMGTRRSAEIVLSAAQAGNQLRTFLQLKLSPQSTPNSLIETDVVTGTTAEDVIVPEIRKGTFPLNRDVDVALFQGQVVTIRID